MCNKNKIDIIKACRGVDGCAATSPPAGGATGFVGRVLRSAGSQRTRRDGIVQHFLWSLRSREVAVTQREGKTQGLFVPHGGFEAGYGG